MEIITQFYERTSLNFNELIMLTNNTPWKVFSEVWKGSAFIDVKVLLWLNKCSYELFNLMFLQDLYNSHNLLFSKELETQKCSRNIENLQIIW